ncbi:MAG: hypothetical protein PHF51_04075 [Candidatus ainarchaeum sp.]|nr:hypothetical protein [Candidatus ainarchaeum sp.]
MGHKKRVRGGQQTFAQFGGPKRDELRPELPRIRGAEPAERESALPDDPARLVGLLHPDSKAGLRTRVEAINRFADLIGRTGFTTKNLRSLCTRLHANVQACRRQGVEGADELAQAYKRVAGEVEERRTRIERGPKFRGCAE